MQRQLERLEEPNQGTTEASSEENTTDDTEEPPLPMKYYTDILQAIKHPLYVPVREMIDWTCPGSRSHILGVRCERRCDFGWRCGWNMQGTKQYINNEDRQLVPLMTCAFCHVCCLRQPPKHTPTPETTEDQELD